MDEAERRHLMESLIDEIQIYEERQPNGQWLKSIRFKLPIIDEDMSLSLDNDSHIETVVLLVRKNPDTYINVKQDLDELDLTSAEAKATYDEIKDYILKEHGVKVSTLYIAQTKRKCGLEVGEHYNKTKNDDAKQAQCPEDKEKLIIEALRHLR